MNIAFSPADEHYIKAMVEDGQYAFEEELIKAAVRRMREDAAAKYERLMAAIEVGEKAIREGCTIHYTPELLDQIEKDARQYAAEGRQPKPDACP